MDQQNMTTGWYYMKTGASGGDSVGPLSWEQLHAAAQAGTLGPGDMVWHPSMPRWQPAGQVQGLFAAVTAPPVTPSQAYPPPGTYMPYAAPSYGYAAPKKRSPLVWIVPTVVVVLAGLGLGLGLGLTRDSSENGSTGTSQTQVATQRTTTTEAETTTTEAETTTTIVPAGPPSWTELNPGDGTVPERDGHAMIYDPISQRLIVFGGYGTYSMLDDTWAYDPAIDLWTDLLPEGSPPLARSWPTWVYDPKRDQAILFGGWSEDLQLDDTWAYDVARNTWTLLSPAGDLPSARSDAAAVYEAQTDKVILFGGWDDFSGSELDDTWAYDPAANTWTELYPGGDIPSPRVGHQMVLDTDSGKVILFGGEGAVDRYNDTYEYDPIANTWTRLAPSGDLPLPRVFHSMAYDPASKSVVLFGGYDGDFSLGDTWAYDVAAGTWSEWSPVGDSPSARNGHSMVYDPALGKVVLFGGYNDESEVADVWSFGP